MDEKVLQAIARVQAAYDNYPKLQAAFVVAQKGITDAITALAAANQGVKDSQTGYLSARGALTRGYQELGDARENLSNVLKQALPEVPAP